MLGFLCKGFSVVRMAEGEENRHIGGTDSNGKGDEERSWAEVVQHPSRAPVWSSYKLS